MTELNSSRFLFTYNVNNTQLKPPDNFSQRLFFIGPYYNTSAQEYRQILEKKKSSNGDNRSIEICVLRYWNLCMKVLKVTSQLFSNWHIRTWEKRSCARHPYALYTLHRQIQFTCERVTSYRYYFSWTDLGQKSVKICKLLSQSSDVTPTNSSYMSTSDVI